MIAAAGLGERLGSSEPKALLTLAGRPLLAFAVATVEACPELQGFVVAAPPGREGDAARVAGSPKLVAVVPGGATRQASVRAALAAVPVDFDAVACHDVARPLATPALFAAVLAALASADGAVPGAAVADTVKRVGPDGLVQTVPREDLVLAQTPQAFRREALEAAHAAAEQDGFVGTDDAALLERAGFRVVVVPGEPANLKVTTPADLRVATALLDG